MDPLISGPFAQQLEAQRGKFNMLFAEARRQRPKLEPAQFADLLAKTATPIVEAVAKTAPTRVPEVAEAVYGLGLDLLGQELLGPNARYPFVADAWQVLFPLLGKFVAEDPRQVLGGLTNAHYNLSVTAGARPHEWAGLMLKLGDLCPSAATLLKAGQVAAWRTGMAHYRPGALALCAELPPNITRAALGLPANAEPIEPLLEALKGNRWLNPNSPISNSLKLVGRVGAFRGFGGLFLTPPTVTVLNGQLFVRNGDEVWLLMADAFGATFHRAEKVAAATAVTPTPFKLDRNGKISLNGQTQTIPELAAYTSAASDGQTLAVTTSLSHAVFLVAVA
jgi:hypothetical protein